jgi:thiol:disulfide interchange protein DsbC
MTDYNNMGITVRYMAYPRAGVGSPSYDKIVSVWCNKDRKQAMSDAKNGKSIDKKTCDNPVAKQLDLGQAIGVRGTPAMFLSDGTMLPGYVQAARLKAILDEAK